MGFTDRAVEEQKFLISKYKKLWKYYDEYIGNICIPEKVYQSNQGIRWEIFSIISEKNEHSRYVMYRDLVPDEEGTLVPGYIVCSADFVD